MSVQLTQEQWEFHCALVRDYELFARHVQKIYPKDLEELDDEQHAAYIALNSGNPLAGMVPFVFHPGQIRLHHAVEKQLKETGRVRMTLIKPRQVGWSMYIQGRGHWRATKTPGMKIHIVSHTDPSTARFLKRVKGMCDAAPKTVIQGRQVDNTRELAFTNGASYQLGTAGNPDALRSDNCHFLHASEEAMWSKAAETTAAIIPALSDGPGSEGYRESTSKGRGTPWHLHVQETIAGENEWGYFFDPWFAHPKYRMTPPRDWEPDDEAKDARTRYGITLTNDQLYWRAMKIKSLRALWMFKQEYPGTIEESFQASDDTLFDPDALQRARKNVMLIDYYAPLIMGVDPARTGDRTVIVFRQGNTIRGILKWSKMDDMRLAGIIAQFLKEGFEGTPVAKCFIDYAIGEGAASRLRELGYGRVVTAVSFSASPSEDRFLNKRAEMAVAFRDWFGDIGDQVSIPDDDDLVSDLLAIPGFTQATGSEKIKLKPKDEIKKLYGKSPDIFDACILTFAYMVMGERQAELAKFARDNLSHLPPNELSRIVRDFEGF